MEIETEPTAWFQTAMFHTRAPRDGREFSFRVTPYHDRLASYIKHRLDEGQGTLDVYSRAIEWGVERPQVDWALPTTRFDEIVELAHMHSMNEPGPFAFPPMETDWELSKTEHSQRVRIGHDAYERLEYIKELCRCDFSVAARFAAAIAFAWWNEAFYYQRDATEWVPYMQEYVDNFRHVLNSRVEHARAEWGADV